MQATNKNRYKIVLSDGKYSYAFAMLAAQLNHFITDETMEIFTVVKIVRFTVNSVIKKARAVDKVYNKIITIHDLEILVPGKEVR
jgi:replication factor A1